MPLYLLFLAFFASYSSIVCADAFDAALSAGEYDKVIEQLPVHPGHYLHELIAEAEAKNLAADPVWLGLGHYKTGLFGGYLSEVDGGDFFTSRRGKTDPARELRATLASFFSDATVPPYDMSAQCRFRARYHWLKRELRFDPARLPEKECKRFDAYLQLLAPEGLTVVFPTTHPNSASSMFGHTLLRVDRVGQTDATKMLDYTLNYAAEADDSGGLSYAIKGLTGGFIGKFHIIPYYMKLREYAQMENRDIWEYRLNLEPETVEFILMHAWELLPTHFDYYFFTENCSYHVLSLIEVEERYRGLTDDYPGWVLPVDTLRSLERRGMVSEVVYNPSHYRVINERRRMISPDDERLAREIARDGLMAQPGAMAGKDPEQQAAILDLAYDYFRYDKIARNKMIASELSEQERQLLLARSKLAVTTQVPVITAPDVRPDEGHKTARAHLGLGSEDRGDFIEFGVRAVYHDWLDPQPGYKSHFALEFGRLDARQYRTDEGDHELKLDRFHLIRLDNFEPQDDFFGRIAWNVATGWESLSVEPSNHELMYLVRGGGGKSMSVAEAYSGLIYGLWSGELAYSSDFQHDFNLATGIELGAMVNPSSRWRAYAKVKHLEDVTKDGWDRSAVEFSQSWALGTNLAMQLNLSRERLFDGWRSVIKAGFYVYF
ncbi:MAG: DUF4105 domain-containing protein [Pseudomonadota bacterium]